EAGRQHSLAIQAHRHEAVTVKATPRDLERICHPQEAGRQHFPAMTQQWLWAPVVKVVQENRE
ncbi:MAG: hypothetical protein Q9205_005336, partial [Flavoplaca limonia]